MLILYLLPLVTSQPFDILLSINSNGHLYISWSIPDILNSTIPSYLVFSRYETLSDLTALPKEGKLSKAKIVKGKFRVNLGQLLSEKLYIYQVGNDETGWSPIYSFLGPVQTEQHYPNLAVLGNLSSTISSFTVLSQLISRSFIARLDGVLLFKHLDSHPLYDTLQSNIPAMFVPSKVSDTYYSVQYYNTYLIFINTLNLDEKQVKWLKNELKAAQKYFWVIVAGYDSLGKINTHSNFTGIFMEYHANVYLHYGEFYGTYSISYSLDEDPHVHFQDTTELLIIQQGPTWADKEKGLEKNNSIYASKQPGYGILNPKYSSCLWQQFSSDNHRMIHQVRQYRIDLDPRKDEDLRKFKIVFAITFIIFLSAFGIHYLQIELEKRKKNNFRPLDSGVVG